jgi:hypothetical protein
MFYFCGDIHGEMEIDKLNSKNFKDGKGLNKDDYLFILGDFGLIWDAKQSPTEKYWIDWLNKKPWTTVVVLGNHENYSRIFSDEFPLVDFGGNKARKVSDSIFILNRGAVYNINGKSFFTMGGGESIDKERRSEFISWWREEMPSYPEYKRGLEELEKANNKVDYILTHSCSAITFEKMGKIYNFSYKNDSEDELRDYLDIVERKVKYKKWYFGHFHVDNKFDNCYCLYNKILSEE